MTLTILNILIIVRFNRIAKKKENLKGPAVHRTTASTTASKNGNGSLRRSASPMPNGTGITRSVSPLDTVTTVGNGTSNGHHLTVPSNGISVDNVSCPHLFHTSLPLDYKRRKAYIKGTFQTF